MKVTSLTGFPGGSVSKEYTCHAGDLGSVPGLGGSPGGGHGNPLFLPGESPWTEEPGGQDRKFLDNHSSTSANLH